MPGLSDNGVSHAHEPTQPRRLKSAARGSRYRLVAIAGRIGHPAQVRDAAYQFTFAVFFLLLSAAVFASASGDDIKAGDWFEAAGALATAAGVLVALNIATRQARQAERDLTEHLKNVKLMVEQVDALLLRLHRQLQPKDSAYRVDVSAALRELPMLRTGLRHYLEQPLPDAGLLAQILARLAHLYAIDEPLRRYGNSSHQQDFSHAGTAVATAVRALALRPTA